MEHPYILKLVNESGDHLHDDCTPSRREVGDYVLRQPLEKK